LAETDLGGLVDGLIGEGSGAGDDSDTAALVDETWHDADLAPAGGLLDMEIRVYIVVQNEV